MSLVVGQTLACYEILGTLGAGAMGEVYRARDTSLDREVAIKILPEPFAADAERLRRFDREAMSLASLNHPNVAQIYRVDVVDGTHFLVLELVPGQDLEARLANGALSLDEAIDVCRQIAVGLEAAHEAGVLHRDLKPANVRLTPDGQAKVLDFGLAKPSCPVDGSPTDSVLSTAEGRLLGTPTYMAPEQARGRPIDRRVDVWAFGCVLYECLAGTKAFPGNELGDVLVAVLEKQPNWQALPAATPPHLRTLLARCLDKDPRTRLRDIGEARVLLERGELPSPPRAASRLRARPLALAPVAVVAVIAGAIAGRFWLAPTVHSQPPVLTQQQLTERIGIEEMPAVSPDGQKVAFIARENGRRQLFLRLLDKGTWTQMTDRDVDHTFPRWVDDNTLIYVIRGDGADAPGSLWQMDSLGSSKPQLVLPTVEGEVDVYRQALKLATFRQDDDSAELVIIELDRLHGDKHERTITLPPRWYSSPRWSPDGDRIAFECKLSLAITEIRVLELASGAMQTIARAGQTRGLAWLPDGSGLVYSSSAGSTMAYPPVFSLRTVRIDGSNDVALPCEGGGYASYVEPDVTQNDRLVASRIAMQSDIYRYPLAGTPRQNVDKAVRITYQTGQVQVPSASPKGDRVAYLSDSGGRANIWVASVEGSDQPRQITFEQDPETVIGLPVWSPVDDWIVYYRGPLDATSAEEWLVTPEGTGHGLLVRARGGAVWSRDGEWLYYTTPKDGINRGTSSSRIRVSTSGKPRGEPEPVREDGAGIQITPDGKTGYFVPSDGRQNEIWRATPVAGTAEHFFTAAPSRIPLWPHQYVLSPDGEWLAAPFRDRGTSNLWLISTADGTQKQITDYGQRATTIGRQVSWSQDGKFLFAALMEADADIVLIEGALR